MSKVITTIEQDNNVFNFSNASGDNVATLQSYSIQPVSNDALELNDGNATVIVKAQNITLVYGAAFTGNQQQLWATLLTV